MIRRAALASSVAALLATSALGQVRYRADKPPPNAMPPLGPSCAGLTVDAQVALRRSQSASDEETERVDFVVTASVGNPCEEPLQVRQGSAITYETNFSLASAGAGQPLACQSREFTFAGTVPPRSQQPFTLSVRNCVFDLARGERPTVSVANGRILTNRGDRAVPATSQTLP